MGHADVEDIHHHVKTYLVIFIALAGLTILTVMASVIGRSMEWSTSVTIVIALIIACVKGSLVAGFFMHLIDEVKVIYWLLGLTVAFFFLLMFLPSLTTFVHQAAAG